MVNPDPTLQAFRSLRALLGQLLRDRAGNTLMIVAAALIPLLAIIGGGVDMGRSYLSQSRLQQACDAGVLAARKKMGTNAPVTGPLPADAEKVGLKFFNVNFQNGAYGTEHRDFAMTLESDQSVSGTAKVDVPTTVMQIFGHDEVAITVGCQAKLNFSNTDIMMVLDTTGSMVTTNPGDSVSRIAGLRSVVKSFHTQLEASKAPATRIRYGFVPYSQSVNVGLLLKPDWMVDSWSYNGRIPHDTGLTETYTNYDYQYEYISGSAGNEASYFTSTCPNDTMTWTVLSYTKQPDGTEIWRYRETGTSYSCVFVDSNKYQITPYVATDHVYDWKSIPAGTITRKVFDWKYDAYPFDVSIAKDTAANAIKPASFTVRMGGYPDDPYDREVVFSGCIEERDTYEISDYANVDLTRALDLDIDRIPTAGNPSTQWRPMFEGAWWARVGSDGKYSKAAVYAGYQDEAYSYCPAQARKLEPMTADEIATYVDSLIPNGNTYHDIGMIWGGRLLSPTGLFAAENADLGGSPTSRHLIFMTDGYTVPYESFYTSYGIDPVDQRRWSEGSALSLTDVVEKRFAVACDEVKKRNITIWVVSFGISLNPVLKKCAGPGRAFSAKNTSELNDTFAKIATSIGDLRVSK